MKELLMANIEVQKNIFNGREKFFELFALLT